MSVFVRVIMYDLKCCTIVECCMTLSVNRVNREYVADRYSVNGTELTSRPPSRRVSVAPPGIYPTTL